MAEDRKHRILLVNFGDRQVRDVARAGFNAERGFVGDSAIEHGRALQSSIPRPLYDYDVYAYDSKGPGIVGSSEGNPSSDRTISQSLTRLDTPPLIRIAFSGNAAGRQPFLLGAPFLEAVKAPPNVSVLVESGPGGPDRIPELHDAIASLQRTFERPIEEFLEVKVLRGSVAPYRHFPVVQTRNGDDVAAYAIRRSQLEPFYIVLPQCKDNGAALVELLKVLAKLVPEWLPDVQSRRWYDSTEFAFTEEKRIDAEIEARRAALDQFVEKNVEEKQEIRKQYGFIKRILVATEDAAELEARLSANVMKVLRFLGFKVEDIDAKIRGAIKRED